MDSLNICNLIVKSNDNGKTLINNVSLKGKTGDIILLYGPNGAGKSTLFKAIMQHFSLKTVKGNIKFNKIDTTKLDTYSIAKNGFLHILQNSPDFPGIQTLAFLRTINDHTSKMAFEDLYEQVQKMLELLELPQEILSRNLNVDFSGGQKKKIELIEASIIKPKVLLIDEMDSGVDVQSLVKIAKFINLNAKNCITILISHNHNFINQLNINSVYVMAEGKIIATGNKQLVNSIEKNGFNSLYQPSKKTKMLGVRCQIIKK